MEDRPILQGQAAMEYLMSYGWAVIVVMLVGIVMWQLGLFDMGGTQVTPTGFTRLKPQLSGTGFTHNGRLTMLLSNEAGSMARIKGVRVRDMDSSHVICCSHITGMPPDCQIADGNAATDIAGLTSDDFNAGNTAAASSGKLFKVELGGAGAGTGRCLIPGAYAGGIYNLRIEVFYDVVIGTTSTDTTETGTLRGAYE